MTYTEFVVFVVHRLLVQVTFSLVFSVLVGGLIGAAFEARRGGGGSAAGGHGALLASLALAASPFISFPQWLARSHLRLPPPTGSGPDFPGAFSIAEVLHLVLSLTLASAVGAMIGSTVARRTLVHLPEATFWRIAAALVALMLAMLVLGTLLACHGPHDPALCR
jgi:hypothetical protein